MRTPPHRPDAPRRCRAARLLAVLLAGAAAAAGCSVSGHPAAGPSGGSTATAGRLTLDECAAGTTVRVTVGTSVKVRLHSTYSSLPNASDPQVLAATGGGSTPTGTCVPGGGCGVVTAAFVVLPDALRGRSSSGEGAAAGPLDGGQCRQ